MRCGYPARFSTGNTSGNCLAGSTAIGAVHRRLAIWSPQPSPFESGAWQPLHLSITSFSRFGSDKVPGHLALQQTNVRLFLLGVFSNHCHFSDFAQNGVCVCVQTNKQTNKLTLTNIAIVPVWGGTFLIFWSDVAVNSDHYNPEPASRELPGLHDADTGSALAILNHIGGEIGDAQR